MKPKSHPPHNIWTGKFFPVVALFFVALCLSCLGMVILSPDSTFFGLRDSEAASPRSPSAFPPDQGLAEPGESAKQPIEPAARVGSAGSKVYVDPVTGEMGEPPPEVNGSARILSPQERIALSTASDDLVQALLTGPAGGVKMDLQGRFRSETSAHFDSQSNLSIRCVSTTAPPEVAPQEKDGNTPTGASGHKGIEQKK